MAHAVFGRGTHTGPLVTEVVGVGPVDQRRATALPGHDLHLVKQVPLAVVAALARVAREALVLELVGGDHDMLHPELFRQGARPGQLADWRRRRGGREGGHMISAERTDSEREDETRVDAARKRDTRGAHVAQ